MTTYFYKLSLKAKIEQIGHHKRKNNFPTHKKWKEAHKMIFRRIKYLYQKKHRYLEAYLQDLVSTETGFPPYKIKLNIVSKIDNSEAFNFFDFKYNGLHYQLKNKILKIVSE